MEKDDFSRMTKDILIKMSWNKKCPEVSVARLKYLCLLFCRLVLIIVIVLLALNRLFKKYGE